uniref:Uncharacterized protein n=1 Tax=Cacopsylla melanoneura TaxID=428564 RepID=A0A8D8UUZ5_9HEMI
MIRSGMSGYRTCSLDFIASFSSSVFNRARASAASILLFSSSSFFFFPASSSSDRVILGGVLLPRDSFLLNPRPSRASVALTTLLSDPLNVSKRTVSSTTGNTDLRYLSFILGECGGLGDDCEVKLRHRLGRGLPEGEEVTVEEVNNLRPRGGGVYGPGVQIGCFSTCRAEMTTASRL